MRILGRSSELGALRAALDDRAPSLVRVSGLRGVGKSSLVRHVLTDYPSLAHVCPPLPDPDQRGALARTLRTATSVTSPRVPPDPDGSDGEERTDTTGHGPPDDAEWTELFQTVRRIAADTERPFVLFLDDAHRLGEARSRFVEPLLAALQQAASSGVAVHVVLAGPAGGLPGVDDGTDADAGPEGGLGRLDIAIGPLPFRAAAPLLPGRTPGGTVRAYGVFGGIPAVLARLDPDVTVGTNVRRLLLSPEGDLADAGGHWVERDLQSPSRYFAILRALAGGEADWATVHRGVSDLTRSGQVAPYLSRLDELGLVESRRSVDAKPGGRARRYQLSDPFFAFWLRFILPYRLSAGTDSDGEGDHYARAIRPRMDEHLASIFPRVCRQHMRHDAIETLGAVAREGGSLWGPGYDLPVAGMLTNGAAYYGTCRWRSPEGDDSPLAEIEAGIRETRYGFGRERRLRLVFTGRPPSLELRRDVLRHRDAEIIDAEALLG